MSFIQKDGYPQKGINKNGPTVTDCVYAPWAEALQAESSYPIGRECEIDARLVLSDINIQPNQNQSIGFVTLLYQVRDSVIPTDSNKFEGGCQVSASQEPISTHPDYLMKWDHGFAKKRGTSVAAPGDYDTAKKKTQGTQDWKWVRWDEQVEADWEKDETYPAIKPGIQSYLKSNPVVTETRFYSSRLKMGQALANVGKTTLPKDVYGMPKTATNKYTQQAEPTFLFVGATVRKEGRKWAVDMTYQFSDTGWDHDVYKAVT